MRFHWDKKYLYWGITAFGVIVASVLFFFLLFRIDRMSVVMASVFRILEPIIYGLVIAYLVEPVMSFFEKHLITLFSKWTKKMPPKKIKTLSRCLGIFIGLLLCLIAVAGLIGMIIPQLLNSILGIIDTSQSSFNTIQNWINDLLSDNPHYVEIATSVFGTISSFIEQWMQSDLLPKIQQIMTNLTTSVLSIFTVAKNLLIGLIVSIYVLYSKDLFAAQAKKILYASLRPEKANTLIRTVRYTHKVFGGFIVGKLLDSLIIGVLCFIGMNLFRMPFPLLVSVIVGVTNIIPFFGPFIGAIPSALIILMVDPLQCLYFIIFILVLQQFDGNILGPKILGQSTGISCFWVIFAILVGSGLFGFLGMLLGVPIFAVFYTGVRYLIERSLEKKQLPVDTNSYMNLHHIDAGSKQIIPFEEESPSGQPQPPTKASKTS